MKAKEKFNLGDRVQMTTEAREMFPRKSFFGVVVGFSVQNDTGVWVLNESHKATSRQRWNMDFWEVVKK